MAHYVWVSPQVDGRVAEVFVTENQRVQAGDNLLRLDARPFAAALEKAASAERLVRQDIEVQATEVQAAEAKVREQQANVDQAKAQFERVSQLVKRGDEPKLRGIEVEDAYKAAQATLDDLSAELELARKTLGPSQVQQARIDEAAAAVQLATLDLDWTLVKAPADGWVTRVTLRPGDVVQTADQLFVLVEAGDWWVEANFKETKLASILPGMPAEVTIDLYGNRGFQGTVESIGPASAASFSLLPAQNTTGNWVKVTQRIPVRIRLQPMDPATPYRLGVSASASVTTEAASASAGMGAGQGAKNTAVDR
jgi:membrane fusion protein, multidrug efflux system